MSLKIIIQNPANPDQYYELLTNFHPESPYFLRTQDGEGMGINAQNLFDYIHKWFEENM